MKLQTALLAACVFGSVAAHAAPVVSTSAGTFADAQVIAASSFTLDAVANVFDSTTIAHAEVMQTGRPSTGYDYYRFSHGGGNVTIDIDETRPGFNSYIGLYRASGALLTSNNDGVLDSDIGSSSAQDSLIRDYALDSGDYVVAVCNVFCVFRPGGISSTFGGLIGRGTQYTLNISASPPAEAVTAVPEPASLALAGLGLFVAFAVRKRG